jgi:hypothetical protein
MHNLRDYAHVGNYGRTGERIILRWRNGVYEPVPHAGSIEQAVIDRAAEDAFLTMLRRFTNQGRHVTDKTGTTYAPAAFAGEPEAKTKKLSNKMLAETMKRLFAANRIRVVHFGSRSRERSRIVETIDLFE